jgi:hypothetical protein
MQCFNVQHNVDVTCEAVFHEFCYSLHYIARCIVLLHHEKHYCVDCALYRFLQGYDFVAPLVCRRRESTGPLRAIGLLAAAISEAAGASSRGGRPSAVAAPQLLPAESTTGPGRFYARCSSPIAYLALWAAAAAISPLSTFWSGAPSKHDGLVSYSTVTLFAKLRG